MKDNEAFIIKSREDLVEALEYVKSCGVNVNIPDFSYHNDMYIVNRDGRLKYGNFKHDHQPFSSLKVFCRKKDIFEEDFTL